MTLLVLAGLVLSSPAPSRLHGSWVFRPASNQQPKAIAFFLGGAFVGAAPHACYHGFCVELANSGYVVLTTPFDTSLRVDHLETCDKILDSAEPAYAELVREFGALPLVGIGHSRGALLQGLLCSVFQGTGSAFADVERSANVLLSFSNVPVSDAIPFFGNLCAPSASTVLQFEHDPVLSSWREGVTESRRRLQRMSEIQPRSRSGTNAPIASAAAEISAQLLPMLTQIEPFLRDAFEGGQSEFTPSADECGRSMQTLYRASATLLLRFNQDAMDESDSLLALLQSGSNNVQLLETPGTHLTLLAPDLAGPGPPLPLPLPLPLATMARAQAAADDFDHVTASLVRFLEEALRTKESGGLGEPD